MPKPQAFAPVDNPIQVLNRKNPNHAAEPLNFSKVNRKVGIASGAHQIENSPNFPDLQLSGCTTE